MKHKWCQTDLVLIQNESRAATMAAPLIILFRLQNTTICPFISFHISSSRIAPSYPHSSSGQQMLMYRKPVLHSSIYSLFSSLGSGLIFARLHALLYLCRSISEITQHGRPHLGQKIGIVWFVPDSFTASKCFSIAIASSSFVFFSLFSFFKKSIHTKVRQKYKTML